MKIIAFSGSHLSRLTNNGQELANNGFQYFLKTLITAGRVADIDIPNIIGTRRYGLLRAYYV